MALHDFYDLSERKRIARGEFNSTQVRSSLLVWCSSGQVVMAGRAGRPVVLLSAWSMSVRRCREVWDR